MLRVLLPGHLLADIFCAVWLCILEVESLSDLECILEARTEREKCRTCSIKWFLMQVVIDLFLTNCSNILNVLYVL